MESRPKSAHRYNVQEQQEVYKEEIARIWKAQWDSLSDKREAVLTQVDEERARGGSKGRGNGGGGRGETPRGRAGSVGSRASSPGGDGDGMSVGSGKGQLDKKVLKIKRLVCSDVS